MSRDVPTLLFVPDKQIVYISIVADNVPEVVDSVFELIDNFGIDISEATITTDFKAGEKRISFFADLSQATVDLGDLRHLLERTRGVRGVRISDPLMTGVAVADIEFPVTTFGGMYRAVIIPGPWLRGLLENVIRKFGATGLYFLYESGRGIGLREGPKISNFAPNLAKLVEGLLKMLKSTGFLNPTGYEVSEGRVAVRFKSCIECEVAAPLVGGNPSCNLVRGLMEGVLETYTGRRCESKEVRCEYKGDEECEVVFSLKESLAEEKGHQ